MRREGGCQCGAVRYAVEGEPREAAHCHCRTCQKLSGAGFITWASFPKEAFAYTAGTPTVFESSAKAQREFCPACGSQLVFRGHRHPTVDITVSTLDQPDSVKIDGNIWVTSRRPWMHGFDGSLPDYDRDWPGDELY